jgi:hypothetical protein
MVGGKSTHGSFDDFRRAAEKLAPAWDERRMLLSATTADGATIEVDYARGARRNGQPVNTRGDRFNTPWGRMPLGDRRIELAGEGEREVIDLGFLEQAARQPG